jgi:hypothetical protein
MKFINQATLSAMLSFAGAMAMAFGQPKLAATFSDPIFVNGILGAVTAGAAVVAALSAPPAPKP